MIITVLLTIFYPHTQYLLTIKYYYYGLTSYETNKTGFIYSYTAIQLTTIYSMSSKKTYNIRKNNY